MYAISSFQSFRTTRELAAATGAKKRVILEKLGGNGIGIGGRSDR